MKNYTIYHLHTMLSNGVTNIDSVTKYSDYVNKAKECGMTSLAFSEHGNVFEWKHKKDAVEKAGMKYDATLKGYFIDKDSKTYSIDLRNYEAAFGKKFDFDEYVSQHDITKVLLIGNVDYYVADEFMI